MKELLKRKFYWLYSPKSILVLAGDALAVAVSYLVSFLLRFGNHVPYDFVVDFKETIGIVLAVRLVVFNMFGLYSGFWRYASISDLVNVLKAVAVSSVLGSGVVLFFHHAHFSRSVLIIDTALVILFIGGIRFTVRLSKYVLARTNKKSGTRTLIVGANDSGESVARELLRTSNKQRIVGYIDDDPGKYGMNLHGIAVLGTRAKLAEVIRKYKVNEIIIALPSASGHMLREMVGACHKLSSGMTIKIVPSLMELIDGNLKVDRIREINITDLLNRKVASINQSEIASLIEGKRLLITGAVGTIGSELARQALKFKPAELLLLDFNANGLFYLEKELKQLHASEDCVPFKVVLGDVRNVNSIRHIFERYRPEIVFHAAAYKHVPLMEDFPSETVENNVFGTKNVAEAAHKYGSQRFVLISTDKAVNPVNVMGTTKLVSEMLMHRMAMAGSLTKFMIVRFGNVLNSSGSAMRIFKEQIAKGGPVTITHKDATRFFMTVEESVCLVLQAACMGRGNETFILNMGEPLKIVDLARNLIMLSGFEPGRDIQVEFTGLRSGEKLHEELINQGENAVPTNHPDILHVKHANGRLDEKEFDNYMAKLEALIAVKDEAGVFGVLEELVPDYKKNKVSIADAVN